MKTKDITYTITTIGQIVASVAAVIGSYSVATFHRDRKRFGIEPVNELRFKPQLYPSTAAATILAARGYETALAPYSPPLDTATTALENIRRTAKLVSPARLKAEKRKGKATR